eukprot:TRINITY_DN6448_c0_g1_i1.p1 TRINITY_DN6448_c0_g1~~TRINITY_DN6448_c0_g1_i1.p1  ORF type:complete len:489 (+),score=105.39 TRINITY_DN6448_c0_g1_i1:32-1468(+)
MRSVAILISLLGAVCGIEVALKRTTGYVVASDGAMGTVKMGVRRNEVPLMMIDVLTYCEIAIGSEGRVLRVMVDSGSSTLAVPGDGFSGLRCPTCFYSKLGSLTSTTLQCSDSTCNVQAGSCTAGAECPFEVRYADLTGEKGSIVNDSVQLGPYRTYMFFGNIKEAYGPNSFSNLGVDGILGIGGKYLNFGAMHEPTLLDSIITKYKLPNIIGISVGLQGLEDSGTLTIGSISSNRYKGTLQWTPLQSEYYYMVHPQCLSVGNTVVAMGESAFGYMTIVDSGTTYTFLPYTVYSAIVKVLSEEYSHLPYVNPNSRQNIFNTGTCFTMNIMKFPVLHFTFAGGVVASVPPENYFILAMQNGIKYYCFGIAPSDKGNEFALRSQTILGDSFMSAFHIVFNRENSSMGIAPAPTTPSTPTIDAGVCALSDTLPLSSPSVSLPFIIGISIASSLIYKCLMRRPHHRMPPLAPHAGSHKTYGT